MKWASALSEQPALSDALDEAAEALRRELGSEPPDLLVAFVSPHHREAYAELPARVQERLGPRVLLGCSGAGVIGASREIEGSPALSLTAARLPEVELLPFHVESDALPSPDDGPDKWATALGVPRAPGPQFVILADPVSCDTTRLLEGLDFAYAGSVKIGGLASDGVGNALFLNGALHASGAVGVALHGNVRLEPIVAQGCRAIGQPYVVTECHQNLLMGLDRRRPTEVLAEIYHSLSSEDQDLLHHALHLGLASTSLGDLEGPREYLIRNVLGADLVRGVLAVGALLRNGQTVRFHLRDAGAAEEDLDQRLEAYRQGLSAAAPPSGALLFSCTGRGEHLFGRPNHDTGRFRDRFAEVPVGGFFCAGEIGPVGADSHLLGFTSSFGVFRPAN